MTRHRLTDEQWALIADEFDPYKGTGRPPTDRRTSIEGIFWILSTGAPWRDLPKEFGPFSTIWGSLTNGIVMVRLTVFSTRFGSGK